MTSQILSSLRPVRRSVVRAALLTLTLSLSGALFAQGPAISLASADIPFAFSSGAKVLPAGHYTFLRVSGHVYALKQADGETVQYFNTQPVESAKNPGTSVIHFKQYNGSYFLEGAWFASEQAGMALYKGKAEKEMQAATKMSNPTGIVLALNRVSDR